MIDVESYVYSRIIYDFKSAIKTKYGMTNDNFSTEGKASVDAIFPFVYIHLLPSSENNQDFENTEINSGLYSVQIEVTDNADATRVKEIMNECIRIMKGMRFNVNVIPEFDYSQSSIYRQIARFSRTIGSKDTL